MEEVRTVRQWIKDYKEGLFEEADTKTQIDAGWYDWFCQTKSLKNKTKKLAGLITGLKETGKIDLDKHYVWFKNNCPLVGNLYDDVRFAFVENGENHFVISVDSPHEDSKYAIYDITVSAAKPAFVAETRKEVMNWLNQK